MARDAATPTPDRLLVQRSKSCFVRSAWSRARDEPVDPRPAGHLRLSCRAGSLTDPGLRWRCGSAESRCNLWQLLAVRLVFHEIDLTGLITPDHNV